ncbi:hypothetical protein NLG97_g5246 [Lecanicillium saksenae]|uniref:Uncharacterized protein n=1 Tax=Lecanicillium saksenae TaxID=468837 RepID=A0ACC1QT30_9HYPO|nr:hypothetical protein NLG97_g5246 [Lecanicillium saksenae]
MPERHLASNMKSPGKPSAASLTFVQEDPTTVQRTRKWAPKTKTGCKTCRIRRVKCDEGRPACKKCISTGRTCDGYETPAAPSGSPPSLSTDQLMRLLDQPAHASGPIYGGSSRAEKEAFFRFYNLTVKQVAGKTDTMFWKINLPQLSQAVRKLAQEIPSDKDGLWNWQVQWDYMDDGVIADKLKPFVEKKIVEYLGVQEEMLVEAVEEHLRKHGTAATLAEELEGALDDEAEDLVKKLWRMVIFFTESEKRGLPA